MSISHTLANAGSALSALSRQAAVASNNVANALTPGYSRRAVALAERTLDGAGAGVRVAGVERATARALTAERRIADSALAADATTASAASRLMNLLGGPEDPGALFNRYASFETALRSLAASPESAAAQLRVVGAATDLAARFNALSAAYQDIRADAESEIAERVLSVNVALDEVANLNALITKGEASGADVTALEDQRAAAIDRINESVPVREIAAGGGKFDLMTPEGVFLLAGAPRYLDFMKAPAMAPDLAYDGGADALSGLTAGGVDVTPGGPSPQQLSSGAFAGLFRVRDDVVPAAAERLDALAQDLVERFGATGLDATLPQGSPGLFTDAGAAFAGNPVGLSARIAVNAAVDPAQGGASWRIRDGLGATAPGPAGADTFIRQLIDALATARTPPAGLGAAANLSASEAAAHLASVAGGLLVAAQGRQDVAAALAHSLSEAETLKTGVDVDAELQNLLVVEQAYAANARVVEAAGKMIERLLEI